MTAHAVTLTAGLGFEGSGEPVKAYGPFTAQILASFAPWLANDPEHVLENLVVAKAAMVGQVFNIVRDVGDSDSAAFQAGWSILLDPTNCPDEFIPYGSQFVGVQIPPSTDPVTARALWRAEQGFKRGTPAAVLAAAQAALPTGYTAAIIEREMPTSNNAPYEFMLIVSPNTLSSADQTILAQAVNNAKPAGINWTLVLTNGWTIGQMEVSQTTLGALEANFTTINGLEQDQPGA